MIAYMWTLFAIIRFVKFDKMFKTAVCVFITGLFVFFSDTIVNMLLGNGLILPDSPFDIPSTGDYRINWAMLIIASVISLILIVAGLIKQKKENRTKE